MAKKSKKNPRRNIYIAVGAVAGLLVIATLLEVSGWGDFLKLSPFSPMGRKDESQVACFDRYDCTLQKIDTSACADKARAADYGRDYIVAEELHQCPSDYFPVVDQVKINCDPSGADLDNATATCQKNLNATIDKFRNGAGGCLNGAEIYKGPLTQSYYTNYYNDVKKVSPIVSGPSYPGLICAVDCMAVLRCLPALTTACYNSTKDCVGGKTDQGCENIADTFTIFRVDESCHAKPTTRLTHTASQTFPTPTKPGAAGRMMNTTRGKCLGELQGFITNNQQKGEDICPRDTQRVTTLVAPIDTNSSKQSSLGGTTTFTVDCAAVVRCDPK